MKQTKKIQIGGIRVQYREGGRDFEAEAIHKAASRIYKSTGVKPRNLKISKKSIDARRDISFVYTVYAEIDGGRWSDPEIKPFSEAELNLTHGKVPMNHSPVIVGFGPAGMFAGLLLAENGYAPLILERGGSVDERVAAVEKFVREGVLDVSTSFGDFTIDLTGVEKVSDHCSVEVNCSFGELELLIPSRFEVKQNGSSAFGDSSVSGQPDPNPQGTIYLKTSVSFGEIHIEYI